MGEQGAAIGGGPARAGRSAAQMSCSARERAGRPPLTFAMVYPFSCHNYELRYWLAACGIDPDRDVRLVVIPPPLLVDAMREGQIDGFCVGEPWNSVAVAAGVGSHRRCRRRAIWRRSPEKVLAAAWSGRNATPIVLPVAGRAQCTGAACWCEEPQNHAELARLLAEPRYVGAPAEILLRGLSNRLVLAPGAGAARRMPDFYVSARNAATFPWVSHALWFYSQMVRWGQIDLSEANLLQVRAVYRPDLYQVALATTAAPIVEAPATATVTFFDGRVFDDRDVETYLRGLRTPHVTLARSSCTPRGTMVAGLDHMRAQQRARQATPPTPRSHMREVGGFFLGGTS